MSAPVLSATEGDLMALLDALIARTPGRVAAPTRAIDVGWPRPVFARLAAQRMAQAAVRFLVDGGGWRARTVLRDGRRVSGRVWDPALNEGFTLRFGATRGFWLAAGRTLHACARGRATPGGTSGAGEGVRRQRRTVRDMIPAAGQDATGDWILYALAARNLDAFDLDLELREALRRKLRTSSPLALLLALDGHGAQPVELRDRLAVLVRAPGSRIVECLDDALLAAWIAAWDGQLVAYEPIGQIAARLAGAALTLETWFALLDAARRLDLARPIVRYLRTIVDQVVRTGAPTLRANGLSRLWWQSPREAAGLLTTVVRFLALAETVLRRRDELAADGYGDPRYEEAQLFLGLSTPLVEPRDRLAGLQNGLSGIIG
jgi:hypothetical protein